MAGDNTKPKVCIYTAIYGGYEILLAQPEQTIDCDFVCFTDDPDMSGEGWRVIHKAGEPSLSPRIQAQLPKLMPHDVFATAASANSIPEHTPDLTRYDYTIWIDANAVIKGETFAEEMLGYLGRYGIAMFEHPYRDCIYDEVEVCLNIPKYQVTPLGKQAARYRSEGYPERRGLLACGVIVRDMRREEVRRVDEAWWGANLPWSTNDQVSLPYVLWKNNYGCDVIRHYLWNNHLVRWEPHHRELLALREKYGLTLQRPKAPTGTCEGNVDTVDCAVVVGWVWDPRQPDASLLVDVYDGGIKLETIAADRFREDLLAAGKGNGAHGFLYHIPDSLRDNKPHSIWVGVSSVDDSLNRRNPVVMTCAPR